MGLETLSHTETGYTYRDETLTICSESQRKGEEPITRDCNNVRAEREVKYVQIVIDVPLES